MFASKMIHHKNINNTTANNAREEKPFYYQNKMIDKINFSQKLAQHP